MAEKPIVVGDPDKTRKRTYADPCGVARALDRVGDRWALLVVRDLLLGPKRFTDLRAGLPQVSPDVLSQRLRELERAGVISRRMLPPPAASRIYELTAWGRELEPVVLALGRWGSRAPFPPGDQPLSIDSFVIALKTLFDPRAAGDLAASYELILGEQTFHAGVEDCRLRLERGHPPDPDVVIETDPRTLSAVLWHGERPADAQRRGRLQIRGDRRGASAFLRLFPVPTPAEDGVGSGAERG